MTDKQDPIAHAARLLREAAVELRQSHTLSSDRNNWIGEPDAKAAYDDHLAAAQALEDWEAAVGAGGVSGPLMGIAALSANAGGPVAWLESEPSTKDWPVRNLFFGFTSFAYSSRLHMGEKPKGADQSQNRFTPLYAAPPTAQAEGFRDGVASVAANAGSEPIAWLVCTEEGDPSMVFLDQREAQMFLEDDERPTPLYTHPSPTSAEVVEHG